MRCLNGSGLGSAAEQIREQAAEIEKRGAAFVYSHRRAEWLIVARDKHTKRMLAGRYRSGMAVLTVVEINRMAKLEAQDADFVSMMVERFGAEVESCR